MKALIAYVTFVVIGAAISIFVGYFVERHSSPAMSLLVFLTMFFANFFVSWLATILVMDGSLRDAQGRASQRTAEAEGQALAASRRAARTAG
jgi:hypothetical protein